MQYYGIVGGATYCRHCFEVPEVEDFCSNCDLATYTTNTPNTSNAATAVVQTQPYSAYSSSRTTHNSSSQLPQSRPTETRTKLSYESPLKLTTFTTGETDRIPLFENLKCHFTKNQHLLSLLQSYFTTEHQAQFNITLLESADFGRIFPL